MRLLDALGPPEDFLNLYDNDQLYEKYLKEPNKNLRTKLESLSALPNDRLARFWTQIFTLT